MKAVFEGKTYLVHFETRKFNTQKGRNMDKELTETTCIIRLAVKEGDPIPLDSAAVRQCVCDPSDNVLARKKAFIKTTDGYSKGVKKALWAEYIKTARITSRTANQKNRKLKKRIEELQARITELEVNSVTEEVMV
jgi:hypothetical protein